MPGGLADAYCVENPYDFDVSGCDGRDSSSAAWDGTLNHDSNYDDWRQTDYGSNTHSISDKEMWAAFLQLDTERCVWVFFCQLHRNGGNDLLLWKGTRAFEDGITGVYAREDGCDETTETVTITEVPPSSSEEPSSSEQPFSSESASSSQLPSSSLPPSSSEQHSSSVHPSSSQPRSSSQHPSSSQLHSSSQPHSSSQHASSSEHPSSSQLASSSELPPSSSEGPWTVVACEINEGGSGYAVGDYLFVKTGVLGGDATLEVTSVDSSGAVTGFTIQNGGEYENQGSNPHITDTNGSGTDCTINVTQWGPYSPASSSSESHSSSELSSSSEGPSSSEEDTSSVSSSSSSVSSSSSSSSSESSSRSSSSESRSSSSVSYSNSSESVSESQGGSGGSGGSAEWSSLSYSSVEQSSSEVSESSSEGQTSSGSSSSSSEDCSCQLE